MMRLFPAKRTERECFMIARSPLFAFIAASPRPRDFRGPESALVAILGA